MASIESYRGHLYLKYYDPYKHYTRRKALHLKDTQANRRTAQRDAKNFHPDFIPIGFVKPGALLNHNLHLNLALTEFTSYKNFRPGTKAVYSYAVKHLITASGDKLILNYTHKDYIALLSHFRKEQLSQNSQSIYTRALHSMFNYFVKQGMIKENIIDRINYIEKIPRPIPIEDLRKIYSALEKKTDYYHQYALIYLLANTGIRISTAIALKWEDIDWQNKLIIFRNVKVKGTEYAIPLVPRFEKLFTKMGVKQKGKVFPYSHRNSIRFLQRTQHELKLEHIYSIHKLKHTFISEMVKSGVGLEVLSDITNTSLRTLRKHYLHLDRKHLAEQLESHEVA